jgi:ATP-dependent Zn protease
VNNVEVNKIDRGAKTMNEPSDKLKGLEDNNGIVQFSFQSNDQNQEIPNRVNEEIKQLIKTQKLELKEKLQLQKVQLKEKIKELGQKQTLEFQESFSVKKNENLKEYNESIQNQLDHIKEAIIQLSEKLEQVYESSFKDMYSPKD